MKLYIHITIAILLIVYSKIATAQQQDAVSLSLEQALNYAIENRIEIKNSVLQEKLAENQVQQAYSTLYPKLTGYIDARDNLKLQTQFVPNFTNLASNERIPIRFGTKYSFTGALELNQPLFDATVIPGLKVAKLNKAISSKNSEVEKENIKLQVYQSYYTVLLNKEKLQLSKKNLDRNEKSYKDAKVRFENDALLKSDLDKLYLDYKNAETMVRRDQNTLQLSVDEFKKTLNIPSEKTVSLTDDLKSGIKAEETLSYDLVSKTSYAENRSDYQAQDLQNQQSGFAIRQAQNEYFPKLKFYGYTAQQHYSDNINFNKWYPYTYLGIRLDVPIFDGFQKRNNVDAQVIQNQTTRNNLEKLKTDIDYEVKTAWVNLQNSQENLILWEENIKIAEDLVKLNEVRFKEGTFTSTDLITSEATLKDTQTNYMIALYDYLVAKVNWQKAKGEL